MENEENNKSNFANKVFDRQDVLILGGLNSGISLYSDSSTRLIDVNNSLFL